jgi:Reverse transcriptase (RNA-dependent DNA polymerase)/Integrase core domain
LFEFSVIDCSKCEVCKIAKHTRLPFCNLNSKSNKIFELVHSDVWGPAPLVSHNGFKYFVIFIDDFSKNTWIYLMKNKNKVFSHFQNFTNLVENQFNKKIKTFRSDNGTKFVNEKFSKYFNERGILHQTSCVYTPQQNGVSERNRHILEITRALLFQNNVPKTFWSEAVLIATYLINRLLSAKLNFKSPLEILFGRKNNLGHLRVFGCTCFVHKNRVNKLHFTSIKTIFLGYSFQKKGYKCYDPKDKKLYISRDVSFFENEPFYKNNQDDNIERISSCDFLYLIVTNIETRETSSIVSNVGEEELQEEDNESDQMEESEQTLQNEGTESEEVVQLRRSSRQPQPSTRLKDFMTYSVHYPIQDYLSYKNISSEHYTFINNLSKIEEPTSYEIAKREQKWCKAMEEELNALEKNETWEICQLPKNKKPVGCKWVYKIKYKSDGTLERYKARLVAKGYTQTQGIDYHETFAPVAKMNTVRILFSIATNKNWNLQQMDVKNAFLQGTLEEEVYMNLPPGHKMENLSNIVCRLKKSIYGLKQSPRAWYSKLSHFLLSCNFKVSNADNSLFTKILNNNIIVVLVYVDDIIITGNSQREINNVKHELKKNLTLRI